MKFKYVGPHDAVDLPGVGVDIERGHPVEVSGGVAEQLGKSADWQRVDRPKPRKPAAKKVAAKKVAETPAAPITTTED